MEYHPVVMRVGTVSVGPPCAPADMEFHVSPVKHMPDPDGRTGKIRPAVRVYHSRRADRDTDTVGGKEAGRIKQPVLPYVAEKPLGNAGDCHALPSCHPPG